MHILNHILRQRGSSLGVTLLMAIPGDLFPFLQMCMTELHTESALAPFVRNHNGEYASSSGMSYITRPCVLPKTDP